MLVLCQQAGSRDGALLFTSPGSVEEMATYLDQILAYHRGRAEQSARKTSLSSLEAQARDPGHAPGATRDFIAALRAKMDQPRLSSNGSEMTDRLPGVIAEIKRRSPSKGDLAPDLDASKVALAYQGAGAAAISVLTDQPHFNGSPDDLIQAREAVDLPVLRKDFLVCVADVYLSRIMGADAVLLIVAGLEAGELKEMMDVALSLDMAALVEVHDENELEIALGAGACLIGVNQRDLHSFEVDRARARRVCASIPNGVLSVAESGITTTSDLVDLAASGFSAVLVGEALVRAPDPGAALAELFGNLGSERLGAPKCL